MAKHPSTAAPPRLAEVIRLFEGTEADPPVPGPDDPIPYAGEYRMRGRWLQPSYTRLRNAAWAVRNSRAGAGFNPLALKLVLAEAERLIAAGEPLWDVLEAYAELLTRP